MSYPYPGTDPLEGLNATPAERLAYLRALDEVEAEGLLPGEPEPDPYGPWDDFNTATAQMDVSAQLDAQRDAQRAAEDIEDALERRPSAETRIERALRRVASGSYTAPPQQFRLTRDAHGMFAPGACSDTDDLGYCSARFHDPGCSATVAGTAAVESVASAEAWNAALAAHTPPPGTLGYAAELAAPADPLGGADAWADLLHSGVPPQEVHQRMMAILDGEQAAGPGPEPIPPEQMPDVAGLRSSLGI